MDYNSKFFKYTISTVLILLSIFLLGQLDFILVPLQRILALILFPFIGGGFIYYSLRPLVRILENRKINRTAAVSLVFLLTIIIIVGLITFGGGMLKEDFTSFYSTFSKQLKSAQESTQDILQGENLWIFSMQDLEEKAMAALDIGLTRLVDNIRSWVSIVANVGAVIILIPIVAFFLLKDDGLIYSNIKKFIPQKRTSKARNLLKDIDNTLSVYITGQLMVALFLGILTYIGYLIIGLPNSLILAVFAMITSIIPFIGPIMGAIPALLIGLTVNYFMIIKILIVILVVQQLEGNLVRPHIMGNRLQIHPLIIIFLVIIAISLYGFVGAFVAIPLYGVVRVIIRNFMNKD
ncbi:AI-2E family transporter [Alkaliphilus serpentinus]|nr:AI-2E family transporter [Alkaliphilus serpentinus]